MEWTVERVREAALEAGADAAVSLPLSGAVLVVVDVPGDPGKLLEAARAWGPARRHGPGGIWIQVRGAE